MTGPSRGVGRLLAGMDAASPPRRDLDDDQAPASNGAGYVDPPALPATTSPADPAARPTATTAARPRRADAPPRARRTAEPPGLDLAQRRIIDVHARRVGAMLRKLEPRLTELVDVVREAERRAPLAEIVAAVEATGWTLDDLPPAMAARLSEPS